MNDTDLMKLMDLSGELGLVLRMNPVWKKEYVIYGGNLYDAYIMCFNSVNVRWNRALMKADYEPPVLSLTEKDTGSRLAILAQNIEMLEEL